MNLISWGKMIETDEFTIRTDTEKDSPYQSLFMNAKDGIVILNKHTAEVIEANPFLSELTGFSRIALRKKKFWGLFGKNQHATARDLFQTIQANGYARRDDLPLMNTRSEQVPVDMVCSTFETSQQEFVLCAIRDMSQQKQAFDDLVKSRDILREQSIRDALTGLFNRRYLEETLEREILRCYRKMSPLGVIMLDVDNFRDFNNNNGHGAGDTVLRRVGLLLNKRFRGADVVARFGGDEFLIIMPDAPRGIVQERAKTLKEEFRHLRIKYDGQALSGLTISCGIAMFPEDGSESAQLIRTADLALYRAKRQGKRNLAVAE